MSTAAPSSHIELDDIFAVDSDEEGVDGVEKRPRLNQQYSDLAPGDLDGDDSNPLLRSSGRARNDNIPERWRDDPVHFPTSLVRQYLNRRNIYRISTIAIIIFVILAAAASIYKIHSRDNAKPVQIQPILSVKISDQWRGFDKIDNWFAFGDSWTDNSFKAGEAQPSEENPFGNPDVAERDIWNYAAYLTLRYNHSSIKIRDLAWSASTIDSTYDKGFLYWLDFAHQLHDVFQKYYITKENHITRGKGWESHNTLFSTFFGINDVFVYNKTNPQWDKTFESYSSYLEELYDAGARIFLIMNIPPVNLAPPSPGDGPKDTPEFRKVVANFNNMVADMAQNLMNRHENVTVFLFDTHNVLSGIHDNPKSLNQTSGLKDVTNFCTAYKATNPWYFPPKNMTGECRGLQLQEYLWRDELHVTPPVNEAIAFQIEQMFMKYTNSSG